MWCLADTINIESSYAKSTPCWACFFYLMLKHSKVIGAKVAMYAYLTNTGGMLVTVVFNNV